MIGKKDVGWWIIITPSNQEIETKQWQRYDYPKLPCETFTPDITNFLDILCSSVLNESTYFLKNLLCNALQVKNGAQ